MFSIQREDHTGIARIKVEICLPALIVYVLFQTHYADFTVVVFFCPLDQPIGDGAFNPLSASVAIVWLQSNLVVPMATGPVTILVNGENIRRDPLPCSQTNGLIFAVLCRISWLCCH